MEITSAVIRELTISNNVIIAGRGANIILGNAPHTYHFAWASSHQNRLQRVMERFSINEVEADKYLTDNDRARYAYFKRFFKVDPTNSLYYHQIFNTDMLSFEQVEDSIVSIINKLD